jgi:CHAT domain-containing protein
VVRLGAALTADVGPALVAADPDFDLLGEPSAAGATNGDRPPGRRSRELHQREIVCNPLPGTAIEGQRIATLLGVVPWLQGEVLERALKAHASPWILHLATHGCFLSDQDIQPQATAGVGQLRGPGMENPMLRSFLPTSGFNTWQKQGHLPEEAEDGMLTAEDVTGMNLHGTALVVLSACDTGMGALKPGEGVYGLRRAFVLAGAQTLVMSLWKVSDLATAVLMERFYTHLMDRDQAVGRDEALRLAQEDLRQVTVGELRANWPLEELIARLTGEDAERQFAMRAWLRDRPDAERPFDHPYFWGAFICQGQTAPLSPAAGFSTLNSRQL